MSKFEAGSLHASSGLISGGTSTTPSISAGDFALYAKVDDQLYFTNPVGDELYVNSQSSRVVTTKSYGLTGTSSGTHYAAGFYDAPASAVTLTQASTTVTHGNANGAAAAHVFVVASGPGNTNLGTVSIVCSGVSITNAGVHTPADSETIVADITASSTNDYYQTSKKWLGIVTYTITPAGGATTYSYTFNYGHAKWEDFSDALFTVDQFEVVGDAGANDTSGLFDIQLCHHKSTGWTYSLAAFVPGNGAIVSLKTDYTPDNYLTNGHGFAYDRVSIGQVIDSTAGEGVLIMIITGVNNAIEHGNISLGVIIS